jgi:hypothetical protein
MNLKEKIDAYKKASKAKVPQKAQDIMQHATQALQNSPQMLNTIKVGDLAPDFTLQNTSNTDVSLGKLLDRGPVVLSFYRGRW